MCLLGPPSQHFADDKRYSTLSVVAQVRQARRYDVSKSVLRADAREFWCTQFGAETHDVPTRRFLETMLFHSGDHTVYRDSTYETVYRCLERVLDSNHDGAVSPSELHSFLAYFGPLEVAISRTVKSLLKFDEDGTARPYAWFVHGKLDRKTVDQLLPQQGVGTFVVRKASEQGIFAMSVVNGRGVVDHFRIVNAGEQGFHFEGSRTYMHTLSALVHRFPNRFKQAYLDHEARVVINVGGVKFETLTGG